VKAYSTDPVERVIRRLLGPHKPPRPIGIWFPRDENGEQRLHTGHASEHRSPSGVRYNRFVSLRRRLNSDDGDPQP